MRVAVLGAGGQLGAAVVCECEAAHDVVALAHADLDVTDDGAVADVITRIAPEAIVNCTAENRVDFAEDHPSDALNLNAFAVRSLARAATRTGATLVHYSTDFVFDGNTATPYREVDRPNPLGVYAASKLLGEWFALDAPRAYVLRVESLFGRAAGGPREKGSLAAIRDQLSAGATPRVFVDRTISPTYVIDAARATRRLLESNAAAGLYHCVNSGSCTWLELAEALARELGLEPRFQPVRMSDVTMRARRPQFCALSNEKLAAAGAPMPSWRDALRAYSEALRHEVGHQTADRERRGEARRVDA
jgi:dTDP-4-dehydrorhamnose reductase